ncbi:MAG: MMPL family transporter, partial [Actinomycetota bacterium]|nr:MMPL family transporter [Actinomycetota bacterium]
SVRSYVDVDPRLTLTAYQQLYAGPATSFPPAVRDQVRRTVGPNIAVLQAVTPFLPASDAAHALVRAIRAEDKLSGAAVVVTGDTAFDIDFVNYIVQQSPLAVGFAMATTIIVLFLLLRSVVLPIKAVLMNLLSLSAAFGAMVWIFQDGHLSSLLNFSPGAIDPTLPVLLFCVVFGLSMDYEVFLLSRIREEYLRTGDNGVAVADGLAATARVITAAAAIMVFVFGVFIFDPNVFIKQIGLGLTSAVLVDATVVRMILVPATMELLGNANWWMPAWLGRLLPEVHIEGEAAVQAELALLLAEDEVKV